jgi:hypothetical protein
MKLLDIHIIFFSIYTLGSIYNSLRVMFGEIYAETHISFHVQTCLDLSDT